MSSSNNNNPNSNRSNNSVESGDLSDWQYLTEMYDHDEQLREICNNNDINDISIGNVAEMLLSSNHASIRQEIDQAKTVENEHTLSNETAHQCLQISELSSNPNTSYQTTNRNSWPSSDMNSSVLPIVMNETVFLTPNHLMNVATNSTMSDLHRYHSAQQQQQQRPQFNVQETYQWLNINPTDASNADRKPEFFQIDATLATKLSGQTKERAKMSSKTLINKQEKKTPIRSKRTSTSSKRLTNEVPGLNPTIVSRPATHPTESMNAGNPLVNSEYRIRNNVEASLLLFSSRTASTIDQIMQNWIHELNQNELPPYRQLGSKVSLLKPLSAYNYFYRDERDHIVSNMNSPNDPIPLPVSDFTVTKMQTLLYQRWYIDPMKAKRLHRASHGKMNFATLSRVISSRWKQLSDDGQNYYRAVSRYDDVYYHEHLDIIKSTTTLE